jgi:site-specific recombinase XerD
MKRQKRNDLLSLVQSFFGNYLERVRGASPHTTREYRDTLKLFFLFLAGQEHRSAANLTLDDILHPSKVSAPSLRGITAHVMRHSCAVALLQAGIDVSVIRDYLGHASVATTSRYITSNLRMKREVLDAFWKRSGLVSGSAKPWRPSPKLLAFLQTL